MATQIEDFIKLATQTRRLSTLTGRGKLEQVAIVISNSQRDKCFALLSDLPKKQDKWLLLEAKKPVQIQLLSDEPVTGVHIVETKIFESRLASLEEADPRRVAMAKKRIRDAQAGKLAGTSLALLEESLMEILRTPLRKGIEKKLSKELSGRAAQKALQSLAEVSQVLITNYETAPNRLRFTWKGQDGLHHSQALSAGVSILFECPMVPSSMGWVGDVITSAREQGACVNGIYFPKEIEKLSKRRRCQKTSD